MYAAKKYMLPKLVRECGKCLSDGLNVDNVIHVLEHSLHLDDQQLQRNCLKLISANAKALLTGAEVLSASRQVLEAILEAEAIPVSESVIYETSINWAKHHIQSTMPGETPTDMQIREALGDLFYKIRFPSMKPTEFAEISVRNNVLTAEEKESIYYFLVTKKIVHPMRFPTERRKGEEVWVDRAVNCISTQWHTAPNVDAINFTTDHDILLTGIGLFTGYNGRGYDVDLEILQSADSLFRKRVTVPYTGDIEPFKIVLDEPILITDVVIYTVKALSNDSIGHYGHVCQPVCVKETVTFEFIRHAESRSTNETCGQIPRLYFCCL